MEQQTKEQAVSCDRNPDGTIKPQSDPSILARQIMGEVEPAKPSSRFESYHGKDAAMQMQRAAKHDRRLNQPVPLRRPKES